MQIQRAMWRGECSGFIYLPFALFAHFLMRIFKVNTGEHFKKYAAFIRTHLPAVLMFLSCFHFILSRFKIIKFGKKIHLKSLDLFWWNLHRFFMQTDLIASAESHAAQLITNAISSASFFHWLKELQFLLLSRFHTHVCQLTFLGGSIRWLKAHPSKTTALEICISMQQSGLKFIEIVFSRPTKIRQCFHLLSR